MKFGVLGTGMVGQTLAGKLISLGHEVTMGSRSASNPAATQWAAQAGARAHAGTFADAARFGEILINATAGQASLTALQAAGAGNLDGKILIDVANPIDIAAGIPPIRLSVCNTDSLAEQIQRAFPNARVVKTLNTMNCRIMVEPSLVKGHHTVFVSGNDNQAKAEVAGLLRSFGWPPEDVVDLGGLESARGTEMFLVLWSYLWGAIGNKPFNIRVVIG
jgi:predicted dinucleotide-binding enzyme